MSLRKSLVGSIAGACALLSLAVAAAATLTRVEWEAGSGNGEESLALIFAVPAPRLSVEASPGGVEVWLPGVAVAEVTAAGIRAVAEPGGTRLRIDRAGADLRSVSWDEETVRIRLAVPAGREMRASSGYRIGVGDVITVSVYKNTDLSGEFPVAHDGTINLPLVGPVRAAGLSDTELAERIAAILDKDFLIDPQVSVSVKTYQSQWIYVTGAVARASRTALSPGMTMKDALSEAGVALAPGQVAVLTRAAGGGDPIPLFAEALEAPDCPMPRDGDVLTVSEPAYVFIQGEVRRPGRIPLTPDLTVLRAIAMSEGLTEWANKKELRILRSLGQETVEERVNLKKVEERKIADPPLKAGDVVLIRRRIL